jgi:hypothetical protein
MQALKARRIENVSFTGYRPGTRPDQLPYTGKAPESGKAASPRAPALAADIRRGD